MWYFAGLPANLFYLALQSPRAYGLGNLMNLAGR